jgi:hypothetical protein
MQKSKLIIPYVGALDGVELSGVPALLELGGAREWIGVLNWSQYGYKPIVIFDIGRGSSDLYIHYFVRGMSLRGLSGRDGEYVHEDSCVEFFMRREGDMRYMNFEFNCIGTCYASRHDSRRVSEPLSEREYRGIRRYASVQRAPFVEELGLFEWELTVAIPFWLMGLDGGSLPEKMYGNLYKCADKTTHPHYVTWSPIDLPKPNYHCPEFFGELYFA